MLSLIEKLEFEHKLLQIVNLVSSQVEDESEINRVKASIETGNDEQLVG